MTEVTDKIDAMAKCLVRIADRLDEFAESSHEEIAAAYERAFEDTYLVASAAIEMLRELTKEK